MTPEERAEAARAVDDYRRASARLRRSGASTFAMAINRKVLDAHDCNAAITVDAHKTLTRLGLGHVSEALLQLNDALKRIASAKDEGRPYERWALQRREAQRVIRDALRQKDDK